MTWLENEKLLAKIDNDGMDLLAFHQIAEWNAVERFGAQKNIMITLSMTLIAAGAAALAGESQIVVLVAMLVPTLVGVLRQYSIETLDRYYTRFLESAVAQRKLQFVLHLGADDKGPFREDAFLEVPRRGDGASVAESTIWVQENLRGGHNNVVWRIFSSLWLASGILPFAAGARLLTWPNGPTTINFLKEHDLIVAVVVLSLVAWRSAFLVGTRHINKMRDGYYCGLSINHK